MLFLRLILYCSSSLSGRIVYSAFDAKRQTAWRRVGCCSPIYCTHLSSLSAPHGGGMAKFAPFPAQRSPKYLSDSESISKACCLHC